MNGFLRRAPGCLLLFSPAKILIEYKGKHTAHDSFCLFHHPLGSLTSTIVFTPYKPIMEASQSPDSFNKEKHFSAQPPRAGEDNRRYPPNSSFNAPKSPYSPNEDQRRFDSRSARPGPPTHLANGDNRSYGSDPSFDSPYGLDGDYQRYDSRPARPAYTQRQSEPAATGAFFAGSYNFEIHGGLFQDNKGDARTDIHYDYSRNSGFGNQYGDRYAESGNYSTNYNGPYCAL